MSNDPAVAPMRLLPSAMPLELGRPADRRSAPDLLSGTMSELWANWPADYRLKLTTSEEALRLVQSGQRVYIGGGCGEPLTLAQDLVRRANTLRNVEIIQVLTAGHAAYAAPELGARGENPLLLESKAPRIPVAQYFELENRFKLLAHTQPQVARQLLATAQADVDERWQLYQYLAVRPCAAAPAQNGHLREPELVPKGAE